MWWFSLGLAPAVGVRSTQGCIPSQIGNEDANAGSHMFGIQNTPCMWFWNTSGVCTWC